MTLAVGKIWRWCLDWIFPRYCLGCGSEGSWCCEKCWCEKMQFVEVQVCPICRQVSDRGIVCVECSGKSDIDGLVVALQKNDFLAELVFQFKYEDLYDLDEVLTGALVEACQKISLDIDLLCCVPLSKKRYWWRGFNQSERMAVILARNIEKPFYDGLVRHSFHRRQVGLSRKERMKNVKGVFEIKRGEENFVGKNILLVDDVCTTMATLNECAQVLKKAGANKVVGVVLARGL